MPEKLFFPFWLQINFAIIAYTQFDIDMHHFLINSNSSTDDDIKDITLSVPGSNVQKHDYFCASFLVEDWINVTPVYIKKIKISQTAQDVAHHIEFKGCTEPYKPPGEIWNCHIHPVCLDAATVRILYAWRKGSSWSDIQFPSDLGIKLDNNFKYLTIEAHFQYAFERSLPGSSVTFGITQNRPKYNAGVYFLMNQHGAILEPGRTMVHADGNCKLQLNSPINIFAFQSHTHGHGIMVRGYKYSNGKISEVIRGDPKNPELYYLPNLVRIDNGDYLHIRCTYDTTRDKKPVNLGFEHNDEMCMLFIVYYRSSDDDGLGPRACTGALPTNEMITKLIP